MSVLSLSQFPVTSHVVRPGINRIKTEKKHIERVSRPVEPATSVELKVTEHKRERQAAFELVHQAYLRSGLTFNNSLGMRVMKHHLCDNTDVLIAKRDTKAISTLTLVRDAEYGLPLESLFSEEVAAMRAEGLRLAEVSCLASDADLSDKTQGFLLLVKMISLALQIARYRNVDRLLLAVHPKHARAYQRLFGCTRGSDVKEYAAVQGNPAVLCMHDFAALDQSRYPLYDQVYGTQYASWQLVGPRMSEAEKWYFSQALCSDVPDLLPLGN